MSCLLKPLGYVRTCCCITHFIVPSLPLSTLLSVLTVEHQPCSMSPTSPAPPQHCTPPLRAGLGLERSRTPHVVEG
eukprot:6001936-Prymnesium_polylepis.1